MVPSSYYFFFFLSSLFYFFFSILSYFLFFFSSLLFYLASFSLYKLSSSNISLHLVITLLCFSLMSHHIGILDFMFKAGLCHKVLSSFLANSKYKVPTTASPLYILFSISIGYSNSKYKLNNTG